MNVKNFANFAPFCQNLKDLKLHFSQSTVRRRGRSGAGRDSVTRCVTGRHRLWRNAGHRDRGAGTTWGKNYQNLPVNGLSLCLTREWLQMHGHYVHPGTGLCCVSYTLHSRCWQMHIYDFQSVTMCYDCNLTLHFGRQRFQPKGRDWCCLSLTTGSMTFPHKICRKIVPHCVVACWTISG